MPTWLKFTIVTVVVAVPAFLLAPMVFPPAEGGPEPTSGQMANFMALGAWDAILLGLGVAVAVFGWPYVRRAFPESTGTAVAVFASFVFLLVSWWPHIGFHMSIGHDLNALIMVDYAFHVPTGIATLILVWAVFKLGTERSVRAAGMADAARAPSWGTAGAHEAKSHRHQV
ncbi:hypothetical protein [Nocardiopsis valliformis]|uniref:hypothetical protein n=1 Tax=Nocardiopsis valliformis TaxID=239974 RepID=UPI00034B864E|nr:hypothetical protein [Nocardiopsis valliformis]